MTTCLIHATSVAHMGRGLLLLGPSGAGKSALALRLIALGAKLVSDDLTRLSVSENGQVLASCPSESLVGVIEARGIGLLRVPAVSSVPIVIVADLEQEETERLPPQRTRRILGQDLPLVLRVQKEHLAESMLLYLAGGRVSPGS